MDAVPATTDGVDEGVTGVEEDPIGAGVPSVEPSEGSEGSLNEGSDIGEGSPSYSPHFCSILISLSCKLPALKSTLHIVMLLLQIPPATIAFVGTKLAPPLLAHTLPQHLSAPSSAAEYLRGKSVSVRRIGTAILHPGISVSYTHLTLPTIYSV